jgi:hypothetical protein
MDVAEFFVVWGMRRQGVGRAAALALACPECGAALRVDTGIQVVTCAYCRRSSFVHWPNQPARPASTMPDYGNIHVPAEAMRTAGVAVALMVIAPIASG